MKTIFWVVVCWMLLYVLITKITQVNNTLSLINNNLIQINNSISAQNNILNYNPEEEGKK